MNHHQETDRSEGGSDLHPAGMASVDLSALCGEESQTQEGRIFGWTQLPDESLKDGIATRVTLWAETLEELLPRVRMLVE